MNTNTDRQEQTKLAEVLQVSNTNLKYDWDNNTWNLTGTKGDIYSDGGLTVPDTSGKIYKNGEPFNWYVYIPDNWTRVKNRLKFMDVINDGDGEGRLRFSRLPTKREISSIRGSLGLRKKRILTEEQKATLRRQLEGSKVPVETVVS